MAIKRHKAEPPTPTPLQLNADEFVSWLLAQMGDTKHEAFAKQIGVTRQNLSMVISGRRQPGARLLNKLKPLGLVCMRRVYVVK
jgi:transcriptional regulator with XRE-family HTH domain